MKSFADSARFSGIAALVAAALTLTTAGLQAQNPDIPVSGPGFLSNPAGSHVVAGWLAVDRVQVYNETDSRYELHFNSPWNVDGTKLTSPYSANYTGAGGTYTLTPSGFMNFDSSLYPMSGGSLSVAATGYDGGSIDRLIVQAVIGYSTNQDSLSALSPQLSIGGNTYSLGDISNYSSQRNYMGSAVGVLLDAPLTNYDGNYGALALVTFEWNLADLGYTGSYENWAINWSQGAHSVLYDVQIAVIPEPTTWALLGMGGVAFVVSCYRRRMARA